MPQANFAVARPSAPGRLSKWLDGLAVGASALCLVHCLALPLIIAALPALGLLSGKDDLTHWLLLGFALPTSVWALTRGRGHAGGLPFVIGLVGLAAMAIAIIAFRDTPGERWLTVAGVLMVATAHVLNWKAAHRATHARKADSAA